MTLLHNSRCAESISRRTRRRVCSDKSPSASAIPACGVCSDSVTGPMLPGQPIPAIQPVPARPSAQKCTARALCSAPRVRTADIGRGSLGRTSFPFDARREPPGGQHAQTHGCVSALESGIIRECAEAPRGPASTRASQSCGPTENRRLRLNPHHDVTTGRSTPAQRPTRAWSASAVRKTASSGCRVAAGRGQ